MLIVLEGIDGTGKTTLSRFLAEALRNAGQSVVETREPGDSAAGQELRRLLAQKDRSSTAAEELSLFEEDRREHVQRVVTPALSRGDWVVQDRTFYSTAAYQGARGLDPHEILRRNRALAPEPNLTLLLLLSPEKALERIHANRESASSFEKLENLREVDRIYRLLAQDSPSAWELDVDRPLEEVQSDVLRGCRERLGKP